MNKFRYTDGAWRAVITQMLDAGWEVSMTKGGHYRCVPPDPNAEMVILPGTPGGGRGLRNARAKVRRILATN